MSAPDRHGRSRFRHNARNSSYQSNGKSNRSSQTRRRRLSLAETDASDRSSASCYGGAKAIWIFAVEDRLSRRTEAELSLIVAIAARATRGPWPPLLA